MNASSRVGFSVNFQRAGITRSRHTAGCAAGDDDRAARAVQARPQIRDRSQRADVVAADVGLRGGAADQEPLGDLIVAEAERHERRNLALTGGQLIEQLRAWALGLWPRG